MMSSQTFFFLKWRKVVNLPDRVNKDVEKRFAKAVDKFQRQEEEEEKHVPL